MIINFWKFQIWFDKEFFSIWFDWKGDTVGLMLNPKFWLKKKFFFSWSFGVYFSSLRAIDRMWEELNRHCCNL